MRVRIDRHLQGLMKIHPGTAGLSALAKSVTAAASGGPVLPPEFTWRDYTVFLLTIAAQIEHSLMVQYLYAAYSLGGPQLGPPVTDQQRNSVAAWRQIILGIAKEEMGHLVTVQNVLKFLGAPLSLDREDYPWDSQLAPYPFVLEPLSRASLAKYIIAESPETWPSDVSGAERVTIENSSPPATGEPRQSSWSAVQQPHRHHRQPRTYSQFGVSPRELSVPGIVG